MDYFKAPLWLVWSNEHEAWWGPNRCGYTQKMNDAGRYTFAEAVQICSVRSIRMCVPDEVCVPSPELEAMLGVMVTRPQQSPELSEVG